MLSSCSDSEEGGQEEGLLDGATDLIGQSDSGAGSPPEHFWKREVWAGSWTNVVLRKDPLPALARWPPSFGSSAVLAISGSVALRPPITRGLPLSGGDLSEKQIQVSKT